MMAIQTTQSRLPSTASLWMILVVSPWLGQVAVAKDNAVVQAADRGTAASSTVDFKHDLIPVLTKQGCNTGACHGAAIGRGGFKLSLYGGDPEADYVAIVRQQRGRRVNLAKPDKSLLLLKPTEQVEHGGEKRFDFDSESAALLTQWVREGASPLSTRSLVRVEVRPQRGVSRAIGEPVALRAIAHDEDGSSRDVTRWTTFAADDSSAVSITGSEANVLRRGRHLVVARYMNQVLPIELMVPLTDSAVDLSSEPRSNFIDEEVLQSLETLGLPPSPIADDATFHRRITLDLTGRLPTTVRVAERSQSKAPLDREKLIDDLLSSDEFTEYWTMQMSKLLRLRPHQDGPEGVNAYHRWLTKQIADDTSYQSIARELILASGDTHEVGPANFFRTVNGAREQAEFASELFLGSRLRCANCHNHPLDRWTQDDYHGLAAIFAKVETGRVIQPKLDGTVVHPRTLEPATQRLPGEGPLAESVLDGRKALADWLTNETNPYFAKAIVNRLWKHLMGRGLVEPVDDFRSTNPATHPELLNRLADDFTANEFSIRHTLKRIASSQTYARSSDSLDQNKDDDRYYSHASKRPLEPEVLADAITDVVGVAERFGNLPMGTRAVSLIHAKFDSTTLDVLGRCDRSGSCEQASTANGGGLSQKLHLFNGPMLNARLSAEGSRLRRLQTAGTSSIQIVTEFYWAALNRAPTRPEHDYWNERLRSTRDQKSFLEDFVWAILSSNEFTTNH